MRRPTDVVTMVVETQARVTSQTMIRFLGCFSRGLAVRTARPLVKRKQEGSCMAITRKEFMKLGTLGLVGGAGLALSSVVGAQTTRPTRTVVIQDFRYKPAHITISPGTRVIWINRDSTPHTVTANNGTSYDSGLLRKGERFSRIFQRAGITSRYYCRPHPHMMGSVTVQR
jgi:plastocyanin